MSHWGCTKCHHEWDGQNPKCGWCGGEGGILEEKTGLERMIEDLVEEPRTYKSPPDEIDKRIRMATEMLAKLKQAKKEDRHEKRSSERERKHQNNAMLPSYQADWWSWFGRGR